jgi:2-hydroxychromene-2-carboxylate isomerase
MCAKSLECTNIINSSTKLAIEMGVFGAPTYIINDQIYWGQDRLDFVERHLASLIKS